MRKVWSSAAAIAATIAVAGGADAATITMTSATDTPINGGNALQFSGGGVTLVVTAGLFTETGDVEIVPGAQNAKPVAYDPGLGATNNGDTEHTVDGGGDLEALILTFSKPVTIQSLTFGFFDSADDFDFFANDDVDAALERIFANFDIPDNGVANITGLFTGVGTAFGVGANHSGDSFKLKKVTFTVSETPPEIPVPAALPLFLAGAAGLTFASRRRRPH